MNFCNPEILKKAETIVKQHVHMYEACYGCNVDFEYVYFENDVENCLINNIERCANVGEYRDCETSILKFTKIYNPPKTALSVFDLEKHNSKTIWE